MSSKPGRRSTSGLKKGSGLSRFNPVQQPAGGPSPAFPAVPPAGGPSPAFPAVPPAGGPPPEQPHGIGIKDTGAADPSIYNTAWIYKKGPKPYTPDDAFRLRYKNLQDMYIHGASTRLKSPHTKKTLSSCPIGPNGKPFKAYVRPIQKFDHILQEQWTVQQRDYTGKVQTYYCYPDQRFDEIDFTEGDKDDPTNVPIDLKLYGYASPKDVMGGMQVLLDLIAPDSAITNLEKQRAQMTDLIVNIQRTKKLEEKKRQALVTLCKFLAKKSPSLQGYHSMERKLKEAKKKVLPWLDTVHAVAIANVGLMGKPVAGRQQHCGDNGGQYVVNEDKVLSGCVPVRTFELIEKDEELLTVYHRNQVLKYLTEYAKQVVKLAEEFLPINWQDQFLHVTDDQRNRFK